MKITSCVPLAGQGAVARHGELVAVTEGSGPDPDPLLSTLTAVAAAAGDGHALVLGTARAALECPGQPAWACAGVTADGGVAVLVHGRAMATVRVEGGREVKLTASDSVIPVSRTYTGVTVDVSLTVGDPVAPDPLCRLDDGVVPGGGLAVTMTAGAAGPAEIVPEAMPSTGAPVALPATGVPEALPTVLSMDSIPGPRPPAVTAPAAVRDDQGPPSESADRGTEPVMVDGVLCIREHFNDPGALRCRQCGMSMDQLPRTFQRRERPPLGVLLVDDGSRFTLDGDYVIGREPLLDGDVIAGRARPLRISDPDGSVSRLHMRISLVGWQVEISDLGSVNGSVLHSADGEHGLIPFEPTVIEPGVRIGVGRRSLQYLSY
jgi:hypothetical protein